MVPPHVWYDGPPLLYMEHVLYGPPHVHMVPHMYNLMVPLTLLSMTLMVPPYLIWNRNQMVPPHIWSDGPPYLIWNMYCMVPPHVHMVLLICRYGPLHVRCDGPPYLIWNRYHMVPPTCRIWLFLGQLRNRSTTCHKKHAILPVLWWSSIQFFKLNLFTFYIKL